MTRIRCLLCLPLWACASEPSATPNETAPASTEAAQDPALEGPGPRAVPDETRVTGLSTKREDHAGLFLGPDAEHACVIDRDRSVRCWGRNDASQAGEGARDREKPSTIVGVSGAKRLALGSRHTCAAREDGSVVCWGDGTFGQLGADAALTPVKHVAEVVELVAGDKHTCARASQGKVWCWGTMGDRRSDVVEVRGLVATHLAAAAGATCAITREGKVVCWGSNASGTVIVGGPSWLDAPTEAPKVAVPPIGIAMADRAVCVFDDGGKQCWGIDARGEASVESRWTYVKPTRVAMGGDRSQLAISADYRIEQQLTEAHLGYDQRAREVHLGKNFGCLVDVEGDTRCWGRNDRRQLARGGATAQPTPVHMRGLPPLTAIALAEGMSCGLTRTGGALCFGGDVEHPASSPLSLDTMASVDSLVSGGGVVCAIARGIPSCWGRNRPRLLWSVNDARVESPLTLGSLANVDALAFGARAGCTVDREGVLRCFGGGGEKPAPPTMIALDAPLARGARGALSLGRDRGCVVHADTGLSCFPLKPRFDPVNGFSFAARRVPGVRGATNIEVGGALACGFDREKKLFCFDADDHAVSVEGAEDLITVAVGDTSACGTTSEGHVKCWGENARGETGRGHFTPSEVAQRVDGLDDVVAIDTAGKHFCALTKDGDAWCWGADNVGQAGGSAETMIDAPVLLYL